MSKLHKHAAVFEAAMRGEADEFEFHHRTWLDDEWEPDAYRIGFLYTSPEDWEHRHKQKTHVVNGFTVPEPLLGVPTAGTSYYCEDPSGIKFHLRFRFDDDFDRRCIERGIAHATKEGAIANCKARLGIDPYKDES